MPDQASTLSGTLRRPFSEQVAFFRGKLGNLVPTQFWDDLEREQHDTAFMVAGAQKADLLSDLAAAVDRTIVEGKSLEAFRKDFRAIVERHGWHGWTGEDSLGGRAWRTRTIYRTNASTSYAAGRYAQLVAGKFAFWVYRHGGSKDPRHEHLHIFDGLCLPPDHPFWKIFYPPSDWGCSCYVVGARSVREARRLGGDPDKKLPAGWDAINPKTGVPNGAGRNWDYAPGASVAPIVTATAEKIRHWDHRIGKGFMEGVPEAIRDALAESYRSLPSVADDVRRYARRIVEQTAGQIEPLRTLGLVGPAEAGRIAAQLGDDIPPLDLFDFSLARNDVMHVQRVHGRWETEKPRGQVPIAPDDYALLPSIIQRPDAIEDGGLSDIGERLVRYVKVFKGRRYVAVFAIRTGRRTLGLKTFYSGGSEDAPPR
ncbi:phage minor head protein [Sphingobium sp. SA2]|uniref:PBECR3 domain-containing polyvalent protein n=1 Tax=Sphingobium sp. SA2 TaxID=1524832 RepID=UPI0028C0CE28|nr:phage minor head protein [Sphingobium sp. SA2]MDT7533740.1 phage minor head protein [Sphingobium sp. SA2]